MINLSNPNNNDNELSNKNNLYKSNFSKNKKRLNRHAETRRRN